MQAPVSLIMRQPVAFQANLSAARAVSVMKETNSTCAVVLNKEGEAMGVVDTGMIAIRLADGESPDTEIFRWMSSPPSFIDYDNKINEAFKILETSICKCLLVTSDMIHIDGIVTSNELSHAFFTAPELIVNEIREANSPPALGTVFTRSQKVAVAMILGHADPYSISLYLSSVADEICKRVIALCVEMSGEPPCRYAFIQTGSAGRMEQTLSTDQDNAIIFENCDGAELKTANEYFLKLGKKVNDMLSAAGYRLCKGGNMAGNPKWCQPSERWKRYFSDWINMPGPEEILEVSIFFDFRFCYGDRSLSDDLREYVNNDLRTNDIFFHYMSSALKPFNPSVSNIREGYTDIKKLLLPLTGIMRLYSLKFGTAGYSTLERIMGLYSGKHLDPQLLHDSIRAWKDLTSMRLVHQASCLNRGTDPDNLIDFQTSDADLLSFAEQAVLKINNLMLKTGNDFYTETI
jgi:CBS domain-containing protein